MSSGGEAKDEESDKSASKKKKPAVTVVQWNEAASPQMDKTPKSEAGTPLQLTQKGTPRASYLEHLHENPLQIENATPPSWAPPASQNSAKAGEIEQALKASNIAIQTASASTPKRMSSVEDLRGGPSAKSSSKSPAVPKITVVENTQHAPEKQKQLSVDRLDLTQYSHGSSKKAVPYFRSTGPKTPDSIPNLDKAMKDWRNPSREKQSATPTSTSKRLDQTQYSTGSSIEETTEKQCTPVSRKKQQQTIYEALRDRLEDTQYGSTKSDRLPIEKAESERKQSPILDKKGLDGTQYSAEAFAAAPSEGSSSRKVQNKRRQQPDRATQHSYTSNKEQVKTEKTEDPKSESFSERIPKLTAQAARPGLAGSNLLLAFVNLLFSVCNSILNVVGGTAQLLSPKRPTATGASSPIERTPESATPQITSPKRTSQQTNSSTPGTPMELYKSFFTDSKPLYPSPPSGPAPDQQGGQEEPQVQMTDEVEKVPDPARTKHFDCTEDRQVEMVEEIQIMDENKQDDDGGVSERWLLSEGNTQYGVQSLTTEQNALIRPMPRRKRTSNIQWPPTNVRLKPATPNNNLRQTTPTTNRLGQPTPDSLQPKLADPASAPTPPKKPETS